MCKPASTPVKANVDLWFDGSHTLDDSRRYKRLIEKLIFLTLTRPDIIFAVEALSRFMHQPRVHWTTTLRILAFVKSYLGKGLLYKKREHIRISGYSDYGYAGDKKDRKSTTEYCIFVRENIVTGGARNKM